MDSLEKQFNADMHSIYIRAKKELGYNATRFLQLVSEKGGLKAAKQLIAKNGGTYGFEVLWEHNRLDLSVEAYVLQERYGELFNDNEKEICRRRLEDFGYKMGGA
jgi:hypothetical protein